MTESFSLSTKRKLFEKKLKNGCCRRAFTYGLLMAAKAGETGVLSLSLPFPEVMEFARKQLTNLHIPLDTVWVGKKAQLLMEESALEALVSALDECDPSYLQIDRCDACRIAFFRGVFVSCGRVNALDKNFSLELDCQAFTPIVFMLAAENGFLFKQAERRGKPYLYTRKSEMIADFFTWLGYVDLPLLLMQEKIVRDIRNHANRVASCESNNIARTVSAAGDQIDLISWLKESGQIVKLPPELRATAELRLQNSEASLAHLATVSSPPMTKSGLNHRLQKICDIARTLRASYDKQ